MMPSSYNDVILADHVDHESGQNNMSHDHTLDTCLRTFYGEHTRKKREEKTRRTAYPNKEKAFLLDGLFDELIEKYVDDGFMTKNDRQGFARAILPQLMIKHKKPSCMYEDVSKTTDTEMDVE